MSKLSRLLVVVALFVFGVVAVSYSHGSAVAQDKEKEKPKEKAGVANAKWEYRIVALRERPSGPRGGGKGGDGLSKAEEELNKLGEEGFEIAYVTTASESVPRVAFGPGGGGFAKDGDAPHYPVVYYTMKRAKK